jgi:hypothetical protein
MRILRKTIPALLFLGTFAGLARHAAAQADPIIYSATNETATRYNSGATYGYTAYENAYVYAPGATQARINSITVGIGRGTNAPTVDISVSIVEMLWNGTTFTLGNVVASKGATLPAVTAAETTLATVSWGDTDPTQRPVVNLQTATNGMNGYGAFWVAVAFRGANAANALNGWKVVNMPTTGRSMNNFGLLNPSTLAWASNFWLGQATGTDGTTLRDRPARFHLSVRGAAINGSTTPTDMLYGASCADLATYHAPQAADGLASLWTYANCFVSANPGQVMVPGRVNVGLSRNGSVAAPAPDVTLELALVRMTWSGTAYGIGETLATASFPLPSATAQTREMISWDIPGAAAPEVPLQTDSAAGYGGVWVAARFAGPNSADTKNSLRVGYLQQRGASTNRFYRDNGSGTFGAYWFGAYDNGSGGAGEDKPARIVAEILGTVRDPAPACLGDLNDDGAVNGADLGLLLGAWGPCGGTPPCLGDLNDDGAVNGADLGLLLGAWGACP